MPIARSFLIVCFSAVAAGCTSQGGSSDAAVDATAPADDLSNTVTDAAWFSDGTQTADLVPSCSAGQTHCGMACVDVLTDVAHCGDCATACAALANGSAACVQGQCAIGSCAQGFADCNHQVSDGCEANLGTDGENCGQCNTVCPMGYVCASGTCSLTCASPTEKCGNSCIDPTSDPNNCGGCSTVCGQVAHGTRACVMSACAVGACDPNYADCDGQLESGCEVNTATDAQNCGACSNVCSGANAQMVCSASMCQIGSCQSGFANCDGMVANGCETNLNSDVNHCGSCEAVCGAIQNGSATCSAGQCAEGACSSGFADCNGQLGDGCETNLKTDSSNCGKCSAPCAAGTACSNGTCVKAGVFTVESGGAGDYLSGVWGSGPLDVYVVGSEANGTPSWLILHSADQGSSWQKMIDSGGNSRLYAVWGSSARDVYAVGLSGYALIKHSTDGGMTWSEQIVDGVQERDSVWGSGPNDVYAGGLQGSILHSTDGGNNWSEIHLGTFNFVSALWGSGPNDVYAACGDSTLPGEIFHSSDGGKTWQSQTTPGNYHIYGIGGSGVNDVYAVSEFGDVLHTANQGTTWLSVKNLGGQLHTIWSVGASEIYVGGTSGIGHSTNGGSSFPSESNASVNALWASSAHDVYAVGANGTILHRVQ